MAAVLPACPPEFLAEFNACYGAGPHLPLRRSITEPPPDLGDVFAQTVSALTPPPPIGGASGWAVSEKNTFLSVQVPEQPSLFRSRTDPINAMTPEEASDSDTDTSGKVPGPPPPPLTLEFFPTEDNYGYGACMACEDLPVPPGLPVPPPLCLEYVETDDPFRRTPAAAERLGLLAPPPLSLEYVATDDPFQPAPTATDSSAPPAPPLLSLEYVATYDPFRATPNAAGYVAVDDLADPESLDMAWPPGLPPPPPIALESFGTEDPFEKPFEPAFVPLPSRPAQCGPPPPPVAPAPLIGCPIPLPPPPPPAQMPLTPAPELEAPAPELEAPMAQPGHTPGAGVTALAETDLRQAGLLVRPATASGCTHVHWAVDVRKLEGQDKQAVSQVFMVELPGPGPTPFKLVLYPKATNDGKHGAGFKKAKGHGRVILKCEAQLPESLSDVSFRVGVGRAGTLQAFRGPVMENFFEHSCHGLPRTEEDWDFSASVGEFRNFLVTLEIAPTAAYKANPGIWWEPLVA